MSLYEFSVPQFIKMLGNVDKWFDKAESHAQTKGFDVNVLLSARLAPDQFHFTRQVQIATDSPKLGLARITGKQAPVWPDDEASLHQLRERLKKASAYLETFSPADFEGAATRIITVPGGKSATGQDHLIEHVIPTFYFHVMTVYAILRHNGVDLGKRDYLGPLRLQG
ncbi:MAG TPA: DUF1993 domain-containing protein [Polyangiales bacterium]